MTRHHRWLLLVVLLLAFGLRMFRLDGQSLWYDEGTSVALAGRSLSTITRSAAADIHPPFYYYLLHGWTSVFGFSPTAVRALSAFVGTALVALTWLLGRRLFGPVVGLGAAFLAVASPFQVYYSQETRMYILVAALGALSVVLSVMLLQADDGRRSRADQSSSDHWPPSSKLWLLWLAYVLISVLVLYTHYFGFTVLLAENLAIGLWVLLRWRRRLGFAARWAGAQVLIALFYLPWLILTWQQLQAWPAVSEPFSLSSLLRRTLRVFSLGLSVEPHTTPAVWAFGFLALLGLVGGISNRAFRDTHGDAQQAADHSAFPWLTTTLYLLVPVITMYVLSLRRPLYNPKFLLLATPPFYLLIALGICHASHIVRRTSHSALRALHTKQHAARNAQYAAFAVLLIVLLLSAVRSLHNYYFDPRFARDDYRGIARLVEATGQPGDAVLLNAPTQIEIFDYYYDGSLPEYPLPQQRPPDAEKVRAELEQLLDQHDRIYGVFWATDESDPEGIVESWLNDHAYKAMDAWYGNARLVLYDVPPAAEEGETYNIGAEFGDNITLRAVTLLDRTVEAGNVLPLTLQWRARSKIEQRYKVFIQLLNPTNQIIAQRDAEPGGGAKLTTTWEPDEIVSDRYGIWVPPGTPPADYRLIAGMYHPDTGQRLDVTKDGELVGDFVDLGSIRVIPPETPPPVEALNLSRRTEQGYGSAKLLGYTLDKRGAEGQLDVPLYAGDTLRITLFWQAQQSPDADLAISLSLVRDDRTWIQRETKPTDGLYPAPRWSAGEVIRDAHDLPLPQDLTPGRYQIRLAVSSPDGTSLGPPIHIPIDIELR